VIFQNLIEEEHILDACYIMEIHQLILNLFGHHTVISQAVHPWLIKHK
jgi:hypothetical protein